LKLQVFERLPCLHRENIDFGFEPAPVDFDVPGFLHVNPVTRRHDIIDVKMAVGVGRGSVVPALLLVFRDDLHQCFLERMAVRFPHYRARDGTCLRGGRGFLRVRQQDGADKESG
jgi:hypothetical protein